MLGGCGADGRFQYDVDVPVYEHFLGCDDSRALQAEVVVGAVEDEVHAVGGDAVDELHDLVGGLATLMESDCQRRRSARPLRAKDKDIDT